MRQKGLFISFEGVDGCGKSTQLARLAAHLRAQGRDVVTTREPGGSAGAEEIRSMILQGETGRWSARTELLLFNAARRDHVERVIRPALETGQMVLCDRFADSTRAYQSDRDGVDRVMIDRVHDMMIEIEPDVTILIDIDPEKALSRAVARNQSSGGNEDRFEAFGMPLQKQIRSRFLELATTFKERFVVINGMQDIDMVARDIALALEYRLDCL